ncbi:hypothetical protein V1525DRAFT_422569 [Lipomyces kononenkoae]|uniref:Uncharacterized protein n=1 Tax=Lipomyces kononenkoae TaxID=34357 RepID=A0ACC3SR57_LIPKO
MAQHMYNNSKHSVTGVCPMESMMGFRGQTRVNTDEPPESELNSDETGDTAKTRQKATDRAAIIEAKREMLSELLETASASQAKYFNQKRIDMQFKSAIGPFQVIGTWDSNAYKLLLPPRYRQQHPVFHVSLLETYRDTARYETPPEAILVDDEIEYEIEAIRMERGSAKHKEYYLKWKGYPEEECTWNLPNTLVIPQRLRYTYRTPDPFAVRAENPSVKSVDSSHRGAAPKKGDSEAGYR